MSLSKQSWEGMDDGTAWLVDPDLVFCYIMGGRGDCYRAGSGDSASDPRAASGTQSFLTVSVSTTWHPAAVKEVVLS